MPKLSAAIYRLPRSMPGIHGIQIKARQGEGGTAEEEGAWRGTLYERTKAKQALKRNGR